MQLSSYLDFREPQRLVIDTILNFSALAIPSDIYEIKFTLVDVKPFDRVNFEQKSIHFNRRGNSANPTKIEIELYKIDLVRQYQIQVQALSRYYPDRLDLGVT
jgi:hypothetical protein